MVDVWAGSHASSRRLTGEDGCRVPSLADDAPRRVREALDRADYSGQRIAETLGVDDMRALDGVPGPVLVRRVGEGTPLELLIRLLLLGVPVERDTARTALRPMTIEAWEALGMIETSAGVVRATYRVVPHDDLLLLSDWPVSPTRPLLPDHVLGPNPSASLLGNATVRPRVGSVLDLGAGCGIQSLLAARHADRVVASDLNPRAVMIASFNAALNHVAVECVEGDLFEPVRGQRFDLVVSNPPFVISPTASFLFRDSELGGEGIGRTIISNVAGLLNERGFCQLLTNWAHIEGVDWCERIEQAFEDCGCNAWVLAVRHAEPDVYASRWIQHLERTPEAVGDALEEWMRYYERERISGISWCVVTMRRATGPRTWFELDEVPEAIRSPVGDHLLRCFEARELLDGLGDDALLELRPRVAPETRLEQHFTPAPEGWAPGEAQLRLTGGLPIELAVDADVANLLVRCDGSLRLRELLTRAAAATGAPADTIARQGAAATRHLIGAGFLLPT
jgi:SAM-dependent methyltransferase